MLFAIDVPTLNSFFASTLTNVAVKLNIQNADFKSSHELYSEISDIDGNMYKLLVNFFTAYVGWYNVHKDIDEAGTAGQLTQEQNSKLISACQKRDQERQVFIDAYEKI